MLPKEKSEPEPVWVCESCGQEVVPSECLIEINYGYEGEAWGTMFRQPRVRVAVSPCCRSRVVNDVDNELPPEYVRPEVW
jgi:hypothetical protein